MASVINNQRGASQWHDHHTFILPPRLPPCAACHAYNSALALLHFCCASRLPRCASACPLSLAPPALLTPTGHARHAHPARCLLPAALHRFCPLALSRARSHCLLRVARHRVRDRQAQARIGFARRKSTARLAARATRNRREILSRDAARYLSSLASCRARICDACYLPLPPALLRLRAPPPALLHLSAPRAIRRATDDRTSRSLSASQASQSEQHGRDRREHDGMTRVVDRRALRGHARSCAMAFSHL